MTSTTLDWYLQQVGARQLSLTKEAERAMCIKIEKARDALYTTIQNHAPRFIDSHFPEFRRQEEEGDHNRWRFLNFISKAYVSEVDRILQQYHFSSSQRYKRL